MSKPHKSPGNDTEQFLIDRDRVRGDKCSPRNGGHIWQEKFANDTRSRVGVKCRKCHTSRVQDRRQYPDQFTGEYPISH